MAINLSLPEPPPLERKCNLCSRTEGAVGTLIHWPSADYAGPDEISLGGTLVASPFSFWYYLCRWHRAADTRRRTVASLREAVEAERLRTERVKWFAQSASCYGCYHALLEKPTTYGTVYARAQRHGKGYFHAVTRPKTGESWNARCAAEKVLAAWEKLDELEKEVGTNDTHR